MSWLTDLAGKGYDKAGMKARAGFNTGIDILKNFVGIAPDVAEAIPKKTKALVRKTAKEQLGSIYAPTRDGADYSSPQLWGEDYAASKEKALQDYDWEEEARKTTARAKQKKEDEEYLKPSAKRYKPLKKKRTVVDDDWAKGGVGSGSQTWEDFFGD